MNPSKPEKVTREELLSLIELHNHILDLLKTYSNKRRGIVNRILAGAAYDNVPADELILKLFLE